MPYFSSILFVCAALAAEPPTTRALDRGDVMAAMQKALPARLDNVNIEIVDLSRFPAPDGEIEFDWKDITPPATGQTTARWRGMVHHDIDHPFSIWAVVRITVPCTRIVAAQTLRPDQPITQDQLRAESYPGFPSENCASTMRDVIGNVATRTISSNTTLTRSMLAPPPVVVKGDTVTAEYRGGEVRLRLSAIAERSGRMGDTIPVSNPSSHKTFLARVTGEGSVSVNGAPNAAKDRQ